MADFFDLFFSKEFEDKLNNELDKVLAENDHSFDHYIEDIVENYLKIVMSIASDYQTITIDRTDFRKIKIDGTFYDLDCVISHNQTELYECLSEIEALLSDLLSEDADLDQCILEIEVKLNER